MRWSERAFGHTMSVVFDAVRVESCLDEGGATIRWLGKQKDGETKMIRATWRVQGTRWTQRRTLHGQLMQQCHLDPSATIRHFQAQHTLHPYNQQSSTVAAAFKLLSLKQLLLLHELMRAASGPFASQPMMTVICVSSAGNLRCKRGCVSRDRGTFECEEGREDEGTGERQSDGVRLDLNV